MTPPAISADLMWKLSYEGRIYVNGDGDQNDTVTAQTSFANTTPTFLLQVAKGQVVIPLSFTLSQSGSVAGGDITVIFEVDRNKRYSTGGTEETVYNTNSNSPNAAKSKLYSGATAKAGRGIELLRLTLAPDVSPAEGAVNAPVFRPDYPIFLYGEGSFLVTTYAASTAPTWLWTCQFVELPVSQLSEWFGS